MLVVNTNLKSKCSNQKGDDMKDASLPYNHNEFDHIDEDVLMEEYFRLKKEGHPVDSDKGIRLRQLKLALDCHHGYHDCSGRS